MSEKKKETKKELVPFDDGKNLSLAELLVKIGQGKSFTPQFPQLRINRLTDDDDGNTLPVGVFSLWSNEVGTVIYGKPVTFRPFMSKYQYRKYDSKEETYVSKSILFNTWDEDILDSQGGFKCGKVTGKAFKTLTLEQQATQKNIRCSRVFYGLATFEGKTAKGVDVKLENQPCIWRVQGVNFMPISQLIESLTKRHMPMYNHFLILDTKRERQGGNVYYSVAALISEDTTYVSEKDFDLFKQYQSMIDEENSDILNEWRTAQKKNLSEMEGVVAKEVIDVEVDEFVPSDLNDDISHVGA